MNNTNINLGMEQIHVTVLRFRVSNKASTKYNDDDKTKWYAKEVKELSSAAQITETLEEFMLGRILISCEVTPITCKHNNDRDRDDTVDLIYTIFWLEGPNFKEMELSRRQHYSALEESFDKISEQANIEKEKEYERQKQKNMSLYGFGANRQQNYQNQMMEYTQMTNNNYSMQNHNSQQSLNFSNGIMEYGQYPKEEEKKEFGDGILNVPNGLGRILK